MDKEQIRKEFNEFLDSASDETIREFLQFIKNRKAKKTAPESDYREEIREDAGLFKNRAN